MSKPTPTPTPSDDEVLRRVQHAPPKPHKEPANKKPPPKRPQPRKPWG
jgi:hypothetical protein